MYRTSQVFVWLVLISLLSFLLPSKIYADIIINEVSPETSPDWFEIYNNSEDSVDLSLYRVTDRAGNVKDLSGVLGPNSFTSFDWSNRLDNSGDAIYLLISSTSAQIDELVYGPDGVCLPDSNGSVGRFENGNTIERFLQSSKGLTNAGISLNPCPTPTPEPTIAPTATSTSTATPTTTSTPVVTKSPSHKPTSTTKTSSTSTPEELPANFQIEAIDIQDSSPTAEPQVKGISTKNKSNLISFVFIFLGLIMLSLGGYSLYQKNKTSYNNENV